MLLGLVVCLTLERTYAQSSEETTPRIQVLYNTTKAAHESSYRIPESYVTIQLCKASSLESFSRSNDSDMCVCFLVHFENDYQNELAMMRDTDLISIRATDQSGNTHEFVAKGGKLYSTDAKRFVNLLLQENGQLDMNLIENDFGMNFKNGSSPSEFSYQFELSSNNFKKGFRKPNSNW